MPERKYKQASYEHNEHMKLARARASVGGDGCRPCPGPLKDRQPHRGRLHPPCVRLARCAFLVSRCLVLLSRRSAQSVNYAPVSMQFRQGKACGLSATREDEFPYHVPQCTMHFLTASAQIYRHLKAPLAGDALSNGAMLLGHWLPFGHASGALRICLFTDKSPQGSPTRKPAAYAIWGGLVVEAEVRQGAHPIHPAIWDPSEF